MARAANPAEQVNAHNALLWRHFVNIRREQDAKIEIGKCNLDHLTWRLKVLVPAQRTG